MNSKLSAGLGAVGTVAFVLATGQPTITAQSQQPPASETQTPRTAAPDTQTQSPAPRTQTPPASAGQVMVTGCSQREADYRRSAGAGRGGAVGTGVGVANEFVLANAMMSREGTSSSAATGAPSTATGTTGANSNTAYELTGPNEGQAATYVGKRVEITGRMKSTDTAPAGGGTANVPGSQDLKLRELEITSIREATGTCAPSTTAP
jgi:hypothetical protein